MIQCHRGCGLESTHINKSGNHCCFKHHSKCPIVKQKIGKANSVALKGNKLSETHKQQISKGLLNSNRVWGPRSEETKQKIKASKKANKQIPWNKGLTYDDPRVKSYVDKQRGSTRNVSMPIILSDDPIYNDFKKYRNRVAVRTKKTYQFHMDELNPFNLPLGKCGVLDAHHIDHIVSVKDGFIYSIPIELIAGKDNLQIIPWEENNSKYSTSDTENISEEIKKYMKQIKETIGE